MNTSFSLIYFECQKSISDLNNAIIGPELFSSRSAAIDTLFLHVERRFKNGIGEILESYIDSNEYLSNNDDIDVMAYIKEDSHQKLALIEHYFEFMKDDLCHSGFSIDELPTSSFIEKLETANAIEIDGNFIRHFNVLSSDEVVSDDLDVYLNAYFISNVFTKIEYEFSYNEVMDAYFEVDKKTWRISGHDVTLVHFS
jgi:hypothetical protein